MFRWDSERVATVARLLLVVSLATFVTLQIIGPRLPLGDLAVYRLEGRAVLDGTWLYGPLPGNDLLATYPPFAAICFVPLALLTPTASGIVMTTISLLVLARVCLCSVRQEFRGCPAVALAGGCVAVLLWSEPIHKTLDYGQVNLLLVGLIVGDVLTRRAGIRGIGVGVAAGIKVTPAIFIVYYLCLRQWRAAANAAGAFAVTIVASVAYDGRATIKYWTEYLFANDRVGRTDLVVNQSIRGVLVRLLGVDVPGVLVWPIVVAVLTGGLVAGVRAYTAVSPLWGVACVAVTGLLCSPISWSHHWAWWAVLLPLTARRAPGLFVLGVLAFQSYTLWILRGPDMSPLLPTWRPDLVLATNSYVIFGLCFLAWTLRAAGTGAATGASVPRAARTVPVRV